MISALTFADGRRGIAKVMASVRPSLASPLIDGTDGFHSDQRSKSTRIPHTVSALAATGNVVRNCAMG